MKKIFKNRKSMKIVKTLKKVETIFSLKKDFQILTKSELNQSPLQENPKNQKK